MFETKNLCEQFNTYVRKKELSEQLFTYFDKSEV